MSSPTTDAERMLGDSSSEDGDPLADAATKSRLIRILIDLAEQAQRDPDKLNHWEVWDHGLKWRPLGEHTAPAIDLFYHPKCVSVTCSLPTSKSTSPNDWANHTSVMIAFTPKELTPLFEAFDTTGLTSYLANRKLIAQSAKLLHLEEWMSGLAEPS